MLPNVRDRLGPEYGGILDNREEEEVLNYSFITFNQKSSAQTSKLEVVRMLKLLKHNLFGTAHYCPYIG